VQNYLLEAFLMMPSRTTAREIFKRTPLHRLDLCVGRSLYAFVR